MREVSKMEVYVCGCVRIEERIIESVESNMRSLFHRLEDSNFVTVLLENRF